ncbi:MAG: hypothetical protein LBI95_03895 [Holosporales bacterium]|jgi:hypothetical protein|nr:hypothetical protein [Holosporales bacterium]
MKVSKLLALTVAMLGGLGGITIDAAENPPQINQIENPFRNLRITLAEGLRNSDFEGAAYILRAIDAVRYISLFENEFFLFVAAQRHMDSVSEGSLPFFTHERSLSFFANFLEVAFPADRDGNIGFPRLIMGNMDRVTFCSPLRFEDSVIDGASFDINSALNSITYSAEPIYLEVVYEDREKILYPLTLTNEKHLSVARDFFETYVNIAGYISEKVRLGGISNEIRELLAKRQHGSYLEYQELTKLIAEHKERSASAAGYFREGILNLGILEGTVTKFRLLFYQAESLANEMLAEFYAN